MKKIIVALISAIYVVGCNARAEKTEKAEMADNEEENKEVGDFVVSRGAYFKKEPKDAAKDIKIADYGLYITKDTIIGQYVGVKEAKVGYLYINKKHLGQWKELKVEDNEVKKIVYIQEGDIDQNQGVWFEKQGKDLNKYINLELVGESQYKRAKAEQRVDFLNKSNEGVTKKDGAIILKCQDKDAVYQNVEDDNEYTKYTYVGKIETVEKYVLKGEYSMGEGYVCVDAKTAEEEKIWGFPYLSPSKEKIISINLFDQMPNIQLNQVEKKTQVREIFFATFLNWMPYAKEIDDMFWSKNDEFYMPIVQYEKYWQANNQGEEIDEKQYLKITILNK